ncbi:MAG: SAM-dependent DNA methyltransferase [Ferruginibacter sp.]|nr:SAM-dependent DNA methyltransferase [Ferruginibacter sp.]
MNLRDHKDWDRINGLLSVSLEPHLTTDDSQIHLMLNGSSGNFCLDYSAEAFDIDLAMQRAWSSDTGYYVKVLANDDIQVVRWWDGHSEILPGNSVIKNPRKFYKLITQQDPRIGSVISFAKNTFLRLRNCVTISENGQESLRVFMYLLAALEQNVERANQVDRTRWQLEEFDESWILPHNWEMLYSAFKNGVFYNGISIKPLVRLVLRHASNRLFQEAHREATKKSFQITLFGDVNRKYDSGISDGAYYTPTPLVRTIVQESLWALNKARPLTERQSLRILDPACGSAEFLREVLRQLKMLDYTGQVTIVGWDISDIACEMAKFVLTYESRCEWNNQVEIFVELRNSLEYDWTQGQDYDLILMNPPFTSFENLGQHKEIVKEKLKGLYKGQPDSGAVFWKNASEKLANEGALGLVLPHSFLNAGTYDKLRAHLKEIGMDFSLIGRLGSAGLFEKAMIIPAILVGTKNIKSGANTILWTDYQQSSSYEALRELRIYRLNEIPIPIKKNNYSIYENPKATDDSKNWSVKSYQLFNLNEKLKEFNNTVGKIFSIKRGVDTGNNAAFLLTKNEWTSLPKKERVYFRPCVMNESIQNGVLSDAIYCFYPYGKYSIETEQELILKLASYYKDKLLPRKNKLESRPGREIKWWELNRHRPWLENNESRLISAYFGRSGYFSFDESGKFLVGQSFAWVPKKDELKVKRYYLAYLALLNAPLVDPLLEMVCNVLDGGYYDLSKHYIDNMPLPDLTNVASEIVDSLSNYGELIIKQETIEKDKLNNLVANLYGVNLESIK